MKVHFSFSFFQDEVQKLALDLINDIGGCLSEVMLILYTCNVHVPQKIIIIDVCISV